MDLPKQKTPVFHRFSRLRGCKVFDCNGEEIGNLEDLFIHQDEKRLHYLDVRAGGFLGLGKRIFLIPMHLAEEIREDRVTLNQTREKVIESPEVSPRPVLETHDRQAVSRHFGGPGGYAGG